MEEAGGRTNRCSHCGPDRRRPRDRRRDRSGRRKRQRAGPAGALRKRRGGCAGRGDAATRRDPNRWSSQSQSRFIRRRWPRRSDRFRSVLEKIPPSPPARPRLLQPHGGAVRRCRHRRGAAVGSSSRSAGATLVRAESADRGVGRYVEAGPGCLLGNLVRRTTPGAETADPRFPPCPSRPAPMPEPTSPPRPRATLGRRRPAPGGPAGRHPLGGVGGPRAGRPELRAGASVSGLSAGWINRGPASASGGWPPPARRWPTSPPPPPTGPSPRLPFLPARWTWSWWPP